MSLIRVHFANGVDSMALADRIQGPGRLRWSRMRMNVTTYAGLRMNGVNLLELELKVEVLKQGIMGSFLGVEIRTSSKVRRDDVFLVPLLYDADLSPDWAPYAEEDAQRATRYDRILED